MSEQVHQLLDMALAAPGVLQWRIKRFDTAFKLGHYGGVCRGVYTTYQEAANAATSALPLGYNHLAGAQMYRDRLDRVWPGDYPMMLWLERAFQNGVKRVFDLGGHVGVSYYAYQKYIAFPPGLAWQVHDVPAVMAAGRDMARERDTFGSLTFVDAFAPAACADALFTSGCLQYLQSSLADMLAALAQRPRWVLLNLIPLHDTLDYWTVQSIGQALCPYRIQRRSVFFADLQALGYEVLDTWQNAEKRCQVAFSPKHSIEGYVGAALKLRGSTQAHVE